MIENQKTIAKWADETFGPVTCFESLLNRIHKEYIEFREHALENGPENPSCAEEMADVVICLMRYAEALKFDLDIKIDDKMKINRKRKWKLDGKGMGQHEV